MGWCWVQSRVLKGKGLHLLLVTFQRFSQNVVSSESTTQIEHILGASSKEEKTKRKLQRVIESVHILHMTIMIILHLNFLMQMSLILITWHTRMDSKQTKCYCLHIHDIRRYPLMHFLSYFAAVCNKHKWHCKQYEHEKLSSVLPIVRFVHIATRAAKRLKAGANNMVLEYFDRWGWFTSKYANSMLLAQVLWTINSWNNCIWRSELKQRMSVLLLK